MKKLPALFFVFFIGININHAQFSEWRFNSELGFEERFNRFKITQTFGIERKVASMGPIDLSLGLNAIQKNFRDRGSYIGMDGELSERPALYRSNEFYLSLPVTFRYNKGQRIRPYLTVEVGKGVFYGSSMEGMGRFSGYLNDHFITFKPGIEIGLSPRTSLTLSGAITGQNVFGDCGHWRTGAQLGLKFRLGKKTAKRNVIPRS